MTTFNAGPLARRWLSAAVASSKDKSRPALDRTVYLEQFHEGMRITATDSYLLLTTFVPAIGNDDELPEVPSIDAVPYTSAVAMDPHGRARGLLGHALGLVAEYARADIVDAVEISVRLGVVDELDDAWQAASFAGMDPAWVVLELPDRERVKLQTFEGEYPEWRRVLSSFRPKRTAGVALSAERMDQLARLAKYQDEALRFELGGESEGVRVTAPDALIEGLVMPVRWNFASDAPLVDPSEDDADG